MLSQCVCSNHKRFTVTKLFVVNIMSRTVGSVLFATVRYLLAFILVFSWLFFLFVVCYLFALGSMYNLGMITGYGISICFLLICLRVRRLVTAIDKSTSEKLDVCSKNGAKMKQNGEEASDKKLFTFEYVCPKNPQANNSNISHLANNDIKARLRSRNKTRVKKLPKHRTTFCFEKPFVV